ncbi:helix-turn-helix transcriptional regulator [Arcicella sp. LKC2W]|uniref:helix-turn-helix domain-containing protein n=1 Tax=Arcicella sp. LKC2W TaxID=2984198 RepID=UPI002B1FB7BD|nr:helix-turn-helix transcriptional regulator [Arcicella sp. LKC2W]MEA5458958.1 helix-turn-helix transcriptional regulator [Arcicella sp. LKC2W]
MNTVYSKIKAIRIEKKLSQQEVGKLIGTNQSNYNRIESGLTQLTIERMEQIAKAFGMTVSELMNYEGGEIGHSEIEEYIKTIKTLEKKNQSLQEQIDSESEEDSYHWAKQRDEIERLKTEIKTLKNIIKEKDDRLKEKDDRLKDKDLVIDTFKMLMNSKGNGNN